MPELLQRSRGRLGHYFDGAVVVAMVLMRPVQAPVDQIVDVIPVRHRLVPATGLMLVPAAVGVLDAAVGIGLVEGDDVIVDMVLVGVMEVSVVQVVDVAIVAHGGVAAAGSVLMCVRAPCGWCS